MKYLKEYMFYNYTDYKPDVINNNEIVVRYTQSFLDKKKVEGIKNIINNQWITNNPVAFEVYNNNLYLTEGHHRFEAVLELDNKDLMRTLFNTAYYYHIKRKPNKIYKKRKIILENWNFEDIKLYEDLEWEFDEEEEISLNISDITNCYIEYDTKQECINIMDKLVQLGYSVIEYGYYEDYNKWYGFVFEVDDWTQTSLRYNNYPKLILVDYDDIKNL